MWLQQLKVSILGLVFILLNLVYLVIELSFNARVLDVSASITPDTDFGQLELYGRTIAATGATILAWRLMLPYANNINWSKLIIRLFLIALLVFPTLFIGQKKLVDDLVDLSSAETRRSAEILSLLKYGIASGFVEIDELAVDELTLQTAEGKMFITLSGLLAYSSTPMRDVLEEKLEKIASQAVAQQQANKTELLFFNYRYAEKQVIEAFDVYQQLVHQLERAQAATRLESRRLYEQAMNRGVAIWQRYRQMVETQTTTVSRSSLRDLAEHLRSGQQYLMSCASHECVEDGLAKLEIALSQILGRYTAIEQWCRTSRPDQHPPRIECVNGEREIEALIEVIELRQLARNAGLERVYASRLDYLRSPDFRSTVFAYLRENGIDTDDSWEFDNHGQILADLERQLRAGILQGYHRSVEKHFAEKIPPRTELVAFNQVASMQSIYHRALASIIDGKVVVPIGLRQEQFEQRFIAPGFAAQFNQLYARLKSGPEWYQDDAPYEAYGKTSLRNLVIPAVAIAFSLVFGLLNMVTLVLSLIFLIVEENRILRWVGISVFFALIVYLPMRESYTIYSQPAYQQLYAATQQRYGESARILDWLARTEPQLYPLASVLRERVLNGFEFD